MVANNSQNRQGHVNINLDFSLFGAPLYLTQKLLGYIEEEKYLFKVRPTKSSHGFYPNICVPLSGIIDYFRCHHGCKFIEAKAYKNSNYLSQSGIIRPFELSTEASPPNALNKVWKFTPETHHGIVSVIMHSFRQAAYMGEGVLEGLELALNEVTDNVIQHSQSSPDSEIICGYVMGQYHKNNNRIVVSVFDTGRGIYESLNSSPHNIENVGEALELALEKGISDGNGAGNGLWMMKRIVLSSSGKIELTSSDFSYSLECSDGKICGSLRHAKKTLPGTTLVDFQLNGNSAINLVEALDGYQPTNLWADNFLSDDLNSTYISIKEVSNGFGSRRDAKHLSNYILNIIDVNKTTCALDFDNVIIVSASFADELIKNLIDKLGIVGFANIIQFMHLNSICEMMFNTCFASRLQSNSISTE